MSVTDKTQVEFSQATATGEEPRHRRTAGGAAWAAALPDVELKQARTIAKPSQASAQA
jgi:hypothetical protein